MFELHYQDSIALIDSNYRIKAIVHRSSDKTSYCGYDVFCFELLLIDRETNEVIADYKSKTMTDGYCLAEIDAELNGLFKALQFRVDTLQPLNDNGITLAKNTYDQLIQDARYGWNN